MSSFNKDSDADYKEWKRAAAAAKDASNKKNEALPSAGDASSVATGLVGLTSVLSGLGIAARRNKPN